MRNITPQVKAVKSIFSELFRKLVLFALEDEFENNLNESLAVFYNLKEGDKFEFDPENEFLFLTWFIFDDTNNDGFGLLDEFMNRKADGLSSQETQLCIALKETSLSIFQLIGISNEGRTLRLRDVFLGNEFEVAESIAFDSIGQKSLLYARVLFIWDQALLVGEGLFMNLSLLEPIKVFIGDAYRNECKDGEIIHFQKFLKENGELINWWVRAFEKGEILNAGDLLG